MQETGSVQCQEACRAEVVDSQLDGSDAMPIAVIGYSFKFPQNATSSDAFWQMLVEGKSARTSIPLDRFNIQSFYHPDPKRHDNLNVKDAHFIQEDIGAFDAPFFSISPTEAASMDPQQRGLLEAAYRAFENAGIPIAKAAGSRTSVHVGSFSDDWKDIQKRDPLMHKDYEATGSASAMLSNRLSWFFDLIGPSVSLDTACSASLMALHLSCQALRHGEANMGLVCGSSVILDPGCMAPMANIGMLSPDGICYSFDHRANGYARGEGFGVVLIKPLAQALRDNDPIRAIIRATGSNQDGRTPSITQPSGDLQERLIRETYRAAGLDRRLTRYFEAHGTGTQTGDPVEAKAIAAAFMDQRSAHEPLYVGAVKTNIGHLEGASGIAGLIKTILILERGIIPQNIWFEKANPSISESDWNIKFPKENTAWPTTSLRRASINSFGFGGSNVHAVLDDSFSYLQLHELDVDYCAKNVCESIPNFTSATKVSDNVEEGPQQQLLVWSAADEDGLGRLESAYAAHLASKVKKDSHGHLQDLAHTLGPRRSLFRWRSFLTTSSVKELAQKLQEGKPRTFRADSRRELGFIFTGQGAQWHHMGRELVVFPVFRQSLLNSQNLLKSFGCGWSLLDEIWKDEVHSNTHKPAFSQPICTALQIALVDLLRSWNLRPSTVVGHSSGEIAAAYCKGSLSIFAAMKIAFYRGQLAAQLVGTGEHKGSMISVNLSESDVQRYLKDIETRFGNHDLSVACVNSPCNVTLSGSVAQVDTVQAMLSTANVTSRKLNVEVAYHSKAMNRIADEYLALITDNIPQNCPSDGPTMFSSLTGKVASTDELNQGHYWVSNLTSKVRFSEAVSNMCAQSSDNSTDLSALHADDRVAMDLLEIGPHSALRGPVRDILKRSTETSKVTYNSILIRGVSAMISSFEAIGSLHCMGHSIDISALNNPTGVQSNPKVLADLPEYPFNHNRSYWAESRISNNFRFREHRGHELLGTPVSDWNPLEARWRHKIQSKENPWIIDHKVNGLALYPAAGMLVMAIEAARQVAKNPHEIKGFKLSDVSFSKALISTSDADDFETQTHLRSLTSNSDKASNLNRFVVYTNANGEWVENCQGSIEVQYNVKESEVDGGREAREEFSRYEEGYKSQIEKCTTKLDSKSMYQHLEDIGLSYGPSFQVLREISYDNGKAVGRINLRQWAASVEDSRYQDHVIHPTALDGVFQLAFAAMVKNNSWNLPTMVPERIRSLWVSKHGLSQSQNTSVKAFAKSCCDETRMKDSSIVALDDLTSEARVVVEGLRTAVVGSQAHNVSAERPRWRRLCYNFDWRPDVDLLSPQELLEYCRITTPPQIPPDRFIEDVEFMCFASLSNILDKLPCINVTSEKPHLRRYVDWMKYQRERYRKGELIHWQPDWEARRQDSNYVEELTSRVESFSAEGKLYAETARNLLAVLEGKLDALELLFSTDLASNYYKETGDKGFRVIEPYVDAHVHKNPGLRILEIGAGTGAFTSFLLEICMRHGSAELGSPRFDSYTFTDISPGFFEKAQERFKDHADRMNFKVLDISTDPLSQGFRSGEFDLIVTANVLHATPNLKETLGNARKLLKPGGKLILSELYNPGVIRAGFSFGLLPGWWLSTESNREWGPLLSPEGWDDVLRQTGFSGTELALSDHEDPRNRLGITMVSTSLAKSDKPAVSPNLRIIAKLESQLQNRVAQKLRVQLEGLGATRCDVIDVAHIMSLADGDYLNIFLPEIEGSFIRGMNENDFVMLQKIFSCGQRLLWLTRGGGQSPNKPEMDMITGLSRCVHSENNNLKMITLALEEREDELGMAQAIAGFVSHNRDWDTPSETEYEERNGRTWINRLVEANYLNDYMYTKREPPKLQLENFGLDGRALELSIRSPGLLDSMAFLHDPNYRIPLEKDEVEIQVKAVGVNFKDVLIALGRLTEGGLGNECAGIVTRAGPETGFHSGDRVCAAGLGTYKTYVRSKAPLVTKIPDSLPFAEAAAIPVVFSTAYQALYKCADLTAGETILIHSGAGGTGQAAIQFAKILGAEIFVTVGTEEKKCLLMDLYGIPDDHIFSSRDMTFAKGVKRMTKDIGVDVILNSLAGESLHGSWDCLAPFGRFVEIGKNDILRGNKLSMLPFNENRSFSAINLTHMISERPIMVRKTMDAVLALFNEGKLTVPQPLHSYGLGQLEDAFRYLQGGKNTGKTVLEINEEDLVPVISSSHPLYDFSGNKTYVIAGGLGGLGKQIARWMTRRGAGHIILLSRSGAKTDEAKEFVKELQASGVNVATPACDISDAASLEHVLAQNDMPPIKGCIQSSMVLEDSLFENMTLKTFNTAIKPKVDGSRNLHNLLPRDLDFFVLLSSACGVTGVRGQSNYAAGNTYQDALARHRVRCGQKAISIDLGMIVSAGYVADRPQVLEGMKRLGYPPLHEEELISLLEYYCDPKLPLLEPEKAQIIIGLETPASLKAQGIEETYWMQKSQFRAMHQMSDISLSTTSSERSKDSPENSIAVSLSTITSLLEATKIIIEALTAKLAKILGLPNEDIDPNRPMHAAGVDSLVAVEVRNWFGKEVGVEVMIFEILGSASIREICAGVAGRRVGREEVNRSDEAKAL